MPTTRAVETRVPVFLVTRPTPPPNLISRPEPTARLNAMVAAHRVSLVVAPAGFGKTSALTVWAAGVRRRVAWLSLTPADRHRERLRRSLEAALATLGLSSDGSDPRLRSPQPATLDSPVLVIDDLQLVDTAAARAELGPLLERGPANLRIILSGRSEPRLGLTRLLAGEGLGRLTASDLAFTPTEVEMAAKALGRSLAPERTERLHALTGGWPVAVRLALVSGAPMVGDGPQLAGEPEEIPQLADYLLESVLDQLPVSLAAFVVRACTCDWVTGRLAGVLSDEPRAPEMLERLLALGLPLERRGLIQGEPAYRWHPVMAQAGRAILLRNDPAQAAALHLRAAHELVAVDPFEAALHALRGREPGIAADLVRSHWLAAVLRGDAQVLDDLCVRLPAPWSDDPEILSIRATCRHDDGDPAGAAVLNQRALAAAEGRSGDERDRFEWTQLLARLFLTEDYAELAEACARAQSRLEGSVRMDGPLRACALLLIGWTELRLRNGLAAVEILRDAALACRAEGLDDLAERAHANRAFALAFTGDFVGAQAALTTIPSGDVSGGWHRTDGAIKPFVLGHILFWSGDAESAAEQFRSVVELGGGQTLYAGLARVMLVHSELAIGDPRGVAEAEHLLEDLPDNTAHALPWELYSATARAGLLLFRGDRAGVAAALDATASGPWPHPLATALAAELYWRCGRPDEALQHAGRLLGNMPAYLRASGLVVTALGARRRGEPDRAHALLEEALELGANLDLRRPFQLPDPQLSALLGEHAERGSRFESFLASQIAYQLSRALQPTNDFALSQRERQIVGYLETTLTANEICDSLFISSNTLKTHLRSIYRKLGVTNRRDAVRRSRIQQGLLT